MTDIGSNTILWDGDKTKFKEINEWDAVDEDKSQDTEDEDSVEERNE
jgi:hypothetical protein